MLEGALMLVSAAAGRLRSAVGDEQEGRPAAAICPTPTPPHPPNPIHPLPPPHTWRGLRRQAAAISHPPNQPPSAAQLLLAWRVCGIRQLIVQHTVEARLVALVLQQGRAEEWCHR